MANALKTAKRAEGFETKSVTAADRIRTPSFKPKGGVTPAKIRKVIRELDAKRALEKQA